LGAAGPRHDDCTHGDLRRSCLVDPADPSLRQSVAGTRRHHPCNDDIGTPSASEHSANVPEAPFAHPLQPERHTANDQVGPRVLAGLPYAGGAREHRAKGLLGTAGTYPVDGCRCWHPKYLRIKDTSL
jgi:hypothetical protein